MLWGGFPSPPLHYPHTPTLLIVIIEESSRTKYLIKIKSKLKKVRKVRNFLKNKDKGLKKVFKFHKNKISQVKLKVPYSVNPYSNTNEWKLILEPNKE